MGERKRFFVQFTPVGWQVRDRETGAEVEGPFGTGRQEYVRARAVADAWNLTEAPVSAQFGLTPPKPHPPGN